MPDLKDVSQLTTIISYIYIHTHTHTHQNTTRSHLNFGILFSLLCFDSNKFLAPVSIMALAQPSEEFHQEIQTKRLRPTTVESIRSIKKKKIYIYISVAIKIINVNQIQNTSSNQKKYCISFPLM